MLNLPLYDRGRDVIFILFDDIWLQDTFMTRLHRSDHKIIIDLNLSHYSTGGYQGQANLQQEDLVQLTFMISYKF